MRSQNRSRTYIRAGIGSIAVAMVCAVILTLFAFTLISCGSGEAEQPEGQPEVQPVTQEENAQALGRIMAHRDQLEGEINEPVDAVIAEDVTAAADTGEETWLLVKVVDFRCPSVPQGTLKAAPGSELSIRLRKTEESGSITTGDSLEINAMVSKSTEGPVIISRAYRVVQ
jgi:hypothetical protein